VIHKFHAPIKHHRRRQLEAEWEGHEKIVVTAAGRQDPVIVVYHKEEDRSEEVHHLNYLRDLTALVHRFCRHQKLDPSKAIVIAGACLYVRGLRLRPGQDIDIVHPDAGPLETVQFAGVEFDIGNEGELPPIEGVELVAGSVKIQTLASLILCLQQWDREKDRKDLEVIRRAALGENCLQALLDVWV